MSRVFDGAVEEYFPDFGVWLKPGDPLPDGAEVDKDDARFVSANSQAAKDAKARGRHIETHGLELSNEPAEPEAASEDTATA